MNSANSPLTDAALIEALAFYAEMGVDEAVCEAPIDRTTAPPPPKVVPFKPRAAKPAAPPPVAEPKRDYVSEARQRAQNAQDLDALHAALVGFEDVPLRAGAKQAVFADGDPAADLMVIGEAPGRDEDRIGKPFVGRSGELLDRMLAAIGRARGESDPKKGAYIGNVIPYRPLQNRTPADDEVAVFLPFIERQIELAAPKVVLCIGNVPAKHLMQASTGIMRYRGTWSSLTFGNQTVAALASFHPAFLLRSPDKKREAWRDLLALEAKLKELT
ncbi:MAG: uracil-DNA glycosylase [Neomegalonema sp.]|nr:uracil-DNA glycosylase [Neomegalonema sp.]